MSEPDSIFVPVCRPHKWFPLVAGFYAPDREQEPVTKEYSTDVANCKVFYTFVNCIPRCYSCLHCPILAFPHMPPKIVAKNRRARFDYEILDTVQAGIVLTGPEVKSCRMGHMDLSGAYVSFLHNIPSLKQSKISPYPFASALENFSPGRDRVLLLKKSEAEKLQMQSTQKGISIIPLEVHAGKYIKVLLGIGRGRKTIDKRQAIKDREMGQKLRKGEEI